MLTNVFDIGLGAADGSKLIVGFTVIRGSVAVLLRVVDGQTPVCNRDLWACDGLHFTNRLNKTEKDIEYKVHGMHTLWRTLWCTD